MSLPSIRSKTLVPALLIAVVFAVAVLLGATWDRSGSDAATGIGDSISGRITRVAVDAITLGNTAPGGTTTNESPQSLQGPIDGCVSVGVHDTFAVDVIADEVDISDGAIAGDVKIHYNDSGTILSLQSIATPGSPILLDPPSFPDSSGFASPAWVVNGPALYGELVLFRLTFKAIAAGSSNITLTEPIVLAATGQPFIDTVSGASVYVGQSCPAPTPLPTETFTVTADFVPDSSDSIEVRLSCSNGAEPDQEVRPLSEAEPAVFVVSLQFGPSKCLLSAADLGGYHPLGSNCFNRDISVGNPVACQITVGLNEVSLTVTKNFDPDTDAAVIIELTCESGNVSVLDNQASEDDPAEFVITGFESAADCQVEESQGPAGYVFLAHTCLLELSHGNPQMCSFYNSTEERILVEIDFVPDSDEAVHIDVDCDVYWSIPDGDHLAKEGEPVEVLVRGFSPGATCTFRGDHQDVYAEDNSDCVDVPLVSDGEPASCVIIRGPGTPTPTTSSSPSSTPMPTGSAGPQPTEVPAPPLNGDVNCSGSVDPVDSLALLRADAGLSITAAAACPKIGERLFAEFGPLSVFWGDVDCEGGPDVIDSLKVLRFDAGLSVAQRSGCAALGQPIHPILDGK